MGTDKPPESQVELAQRAYDARAPTYEDSFHPDYSKRLMDLVQPKPADKVLVLACGTGLESFIAAEKVGPSGEIIGGIGTRSRIKFVSGDVTKLENVEGVSSEEGSFDWIVCSNAFVRNFIAGTVMERVARRMGVPFPMSRAWVKSRDSFKEVLEGEGYVIERIEDMEKISGKGDQSYGLDKADDQFEYIVNSGWTPKTFNGDAREEARKLFAEEWAKIAVDGKVENIDVLYVYIARPE
ncbi:hypothetical protein F5X68DRAFT_229666 [Plectosphaerella plurivora]|uniref:Methyltransferase domain-containing protein n=1 Tax=Plectosphaerella plurivora TaxID=936078 RepID=A0A9P8VFN4_9PEZI|nr:hypothetical protein F5X68DRAFT_229666 [Plectosphaerella plurivora]